MKIQFNFLLIFLLLLGCKNQPPAEKVQIQGVMAENGMVVSAHPLATKVGLEVLEAGGNAYDAAVAVHFALTVVYPRAGNIGGGGFLVTRTANGDFFSLDFREKAPLAAHKDMYLDENGDPIDNLSTQGHLAVGVPGSVAGMVKMHENFGALDWQEVVQPAIDLAREGFALTKAEADKLNVYQSTFKEANPDEDMPFLNAEGWKEGDTIYLPALAETFERIKTDKYNGFYKGETAERLAKEMADNGGLITKEDLEKYEALWRMPLEGEYDEYKIVSMPPPSSGGIALLQLMKGVAQNHYKLGKHNDVKTAHLYTELERRVYADRATYLGDSDFFNVPVNELISDNYLSLRYSNIDWEKATPSQQIKEGKVDVIESIETTHYSIIDKEGNAVSITTTLNGNYGSKVFVEELGFFLNNEMDDFSIKPGVPNMFGLVGAEANKIEAEKRMLSSMTPTIVEKNGELFLVVGTPGGSTIITSVFQTIMNVIEFDMNMQQAVNAKKLHSQWLPDQILVEDGALTDEAKQNLEQMGHKLVEVPAIGRLDCIMVHENGLLEGAADPRGDDFAMGY